MASEEKSHSCYLISPFQGEYQDVRHQIRESLLEMNVAPVLMEYMPPSAHTIAEVVLNQIQEADFIIADVSKNNSNVMVEVGYALAHKKPILLIVQKSSREIPAILSSYLYHVYDPKEPDLLKETLRTWIPRILDRISEEGRT